MEIRAAEISAILKKQIADFGSEAAPNSSLNSPKLRRKFG